MLWRKRRLFLKVILSSNRNPHFVTIAEYIEKAFNASDCQTYFFNNDGFSIPGRVRHMIQYLQQFDIKKINKDLISLIKSFKPHFFIEAGGHRILPETVKAIKGHGIKTALWTIDCPLNFEPVIKAAPYYDFVFTGGSEAYEILKEKGIRNLHFLPFACEPDLHEPQILSENDQKLYGADIVFVGSVHPELYPFRIKFLESIADHDLAVWGPGSSSIPRDSPLKKRIRGEKTPPDAWARIYSASKIVLCLHYKDPAGRIPCHQASPRVYEALSCGAFLMVDAQRDVMSLFKDREELVLFRDTEELGALIKYYLERPEERIRISEKGRRTVLEKHTYRRRIDEILKVAAGHD